MDIMVTKDAGDPLDHDSLLDAILGIANAHTLLMNSMTDEEAGLHIKSIIDEHSIVWVIWPDAKHATGVGLKLLVDKFGIMQGKAEQMVAISAIACPDEEAADHIIALVERSESTSRSDN